MNPAHRQRVSRKPSRQAGLGPSPAPPQNPRAHSPPKADFLKRFQDKPDANDDLFFEEVAYDEDLDDDFKTLKISDVDRWRQGLKGANTKASRRNLHQFVETEDDFEDFHDDFDDRNAHGLDYELESKRENHQRAQAQKKGGISPATRSSSSPMRRVSLSEYSENTNETDLTSELNGEEFENIDDIFGDEESGIYSSGGGQQNDIRAKQRLLKQQQYRQAEAQKEEEDLLRQWKGREEVNTLRLKDLNSVDLDKDALENERTINYEYTRDDFEDFEDGFELEPAVKFQPGATAKFGRLPAKISMPDVRQSSKAISQSKKFKSTMDLNHEIRQPSAFNSSNRVISKLDRIPSFYHKPASDPPKSKEEKDEAQINDIEKKKQQLLNKYMEFTVKQNKISRKNRQHAERPRNSKIGLVRNLNEVPVTTGNHRMKYDPVKKMWEGNNIELVKFEKIRQKPSRPSLITANDFKSNNKDKKIQGNMIYDAEQMRWINLEEEEDVFGEVSDLVTPDVRDRGVSTFTQRTTSTNSAVSVPSTTQESTRQVTRQEDFYIPIKVLDKFRKEESKIRKKTTHWFNKYETYSPQKSSGHDDFRWEIRKMVMDTD